MSQSVVEKAVCEECGVDVRENTFFCYNCGNRLAEPEMSGSSENDIRSSNHKHASEPVGKPDTPLEEPIDDGISREAKAALDDLAERIRIEPSASDDESIALAAARRKKARRAKRMTREYVWEPVEDPPGRPLLAIVALITLLATLAVVITLVWK